MREEAMAADAGPLGLSEAQLVSLLKARSREAWTEIYKAYYRPIYRYVKARVFDEATVEDLTSSVFLAALKGIGSYRYRGRPLLAWLYRIARNLVGSHQRQLLRPRSRDPRRGLDLARLVIWRVMHRPRSEDSWPDDPQPVWAPNAQRDPDAIVERLDLRDALNKLTGAQREVIILRFFMGLSTEEIARVLGKAAAAVYSLEARALLSLRKALR